jgi:serine/threonine-protein kinase
MATAAPNTAQGAFLGTVQYMAPEQLEGREADARSDIWALGAVLYEMATGRRPFAGDSPATVISAILRDTPPAVSTRQPLVPRALDRLIDQCLAKDPEERWQSIGDVRRMLEAIADNQTADRNPDARRSGAWRERTVWMATTALLLMALALVTLRPSPVAPLLASSVSR